MDFSDSGGDSHTEDGKGLMGSVLNGQFGISKSVLRNMFIDNGVGDPKDFVVTRDNTLKRVMNFVKNNSKK